MAPREHHDFDNNGECISRQRNWHDFYKKWFLLVIGGQILASPSSNTTILTLRAKRLFLVPWEHHEFNNIGKYISRHRKWPDFYNKWLSFVFRAKKLSSPSWNTTILIIWAKRLSMAPREHHDFENIGNYISWHRNWHDFIKNGFYWWLGPNIGIAFEEHHDFDNLSKKVVYGTPGTPWFRQYWQMYLSAPKTTWFL